MRPDELMVGDIVRLRISHNAVRIESIFTSKHTEGYLCHHTFLHNGEKRYNYSLSMLEPVPLTKDALAKSGFFIQDQGGNKADVWCGFGEDCQYDIEVEFDGETPVHVKIDGPTHITTREIEFIHQFQHALRLAGVNKEITI